jgi:hypothetical protein
VKPIISCCGPNSTGTTLSFPRILSRSQDIQEEKKPTTLLKILEDAIEADFSIPGSPVGSASSVNSLDEATLAFGSAEMTSTVQGLLENAFKVDYNQYGIPGSPVGSLISLDETTQTASGSTMPHSETDNELCMALDAMAEETEFASFVARNVWEECGDLKTTLLVLRAMKDAADRVFTYWETVYHVVM